MHSGDALHPSLRDTAPGGSFTGGDHGLWKQETVPHPHPGSRFLRGLEAGGTRRNPCKPHRKPRAGPRRVPWGKSRQRLRLGFLLCYVGIWARNDAQPPALTSRLTTGSEDRPLDGSRTPGLSPSPASVGGSHSPLPRHPGRPPTLLTTRVGRFPHVNYRLFEKMNFAFLGGQTGTRDGCEGQTEGTSPLGPVSALQTPPRVSRSPSRR